MVIDILLNNSWLVIIIWIIIYSSDYFLSVLAAHLYNRGVFKHLEYEGGIELTPALRNDVNSRKILSRRYFLALILISLLIYFTSTDTQIGSFELVIGSIFLTEITVHFRHIRTQFLFRSLLKSEGASGKIIYKRWFMLKTSAIEAGTFSFFFFLLFLLFQRQFFLGGAATSLGLAIFHLILAFREKERKK